MTDKNKMIPFKVRVKTETSNAWLIEFEPSKVEWIPKSPCEYHGHDFKTELDMITIPQWLVEDRELENYAEE